MISRRGALRATGSWSSMAMVCRISSGETLGLAMYTVTTCGGSRVGSMWHSMVLPLPTSPVTLMMPSPCVTA